MYINVIFYQPLQVRNVDSSAGDDTYSVVSMALSQESRSSTSSFCEEVTKSDMEEAGRSTVVIISSDDRLELTVSPGAIETLQDIVDVSVL